MLHQTFLFLGQLWQLFEVSQILEFLRYHFPRHLCHTKSGMTQSVAHKGITILSPPHNVITKHESVKGVNLS